MAIKATTDISKIKFLPGDVMPLPPGWLSLLEARILYTCATKVDGNICEIGSWVGRSTCAIGYGVRDRAQPVIFDVIDFGIAGIDEYRRRFGKVPMDNVKIMEGVFFPGGSVALLKQNLVAHGIMKFVRSIFLGDVMDYRSSVTYEFIFCDTTYDEVEINRNIPIIRELLNQNFIVVCDDVIRDEQCSMISRMLDADEYTILNEYDKYSKLLIITKGEYNGTISSTGEK